MTWRIEQGDALEVLRTLPKQSVQTCVTSPPYFGLRDYGMDGQLGLEATPDEYVAKLVEVFLEVRRVLRDDGTVWLNLGDSYAGGAGGRGDVGREIPRPDGSTGVPSAKHDGGRLPRNTPGLKPKDLIGIPWLVVFALRADGWYLRSEIIWAKPNPMPESVTDRPTRSHEQVFLFSKASRYFYDADAVREDQSASAAAAWYRNNVVEQRHPRGARSVGGSNSGLNGATAETGGRNKRSVWTVTTQPFPSAHFATFPPKLIEPCILAGSSPTACGECGAPWERVVERIGFDNGDGSPGERGLGDARRLSRDETGRGDGFTKPPRNAGRSTETIGWQPTCSHTDDTGRSVVLDPFAGAGTTGVVALRHDRDFLGIELNPEYVELARRRICDDAPLLNTPAEAA